MIKISIALIKELRDRTGVGLIECKQALIKSQGKIELAIDYMRKLGQAKAVKKVNHIVTEGIICVNIGHNCKYGALIELNCETDFVAKNDSFICFGKKIITTAVKQKIIDTQKLKSIFEDLRTSLVSKFGENINIRRLGVLKENIIGSYLHYNNNIGVIISGININKELIKYIAMHIAANNPKYVNAKDIPMNIIDREYKIQSDIAMKINKQDEINKKIIEGRMHKFINEISLYNQPFLMDSTRTVAQVLNEHGSTINNFIRFEVGEGI